MKSANSGKGYAMRTIKNTGDAAVWIVFCVFIISVFASMILGIGVYQNINEASRSGQEERVGLSYIWSKIKCGEAAGIVYIGDFHGISTLFIDEELGGSLHRTAIYNYDDWIYELFYHAEDEFLPGDLYSPMDGVPVLRNQSLQFEQLENGLLNVSLGNERLVVYPRNDYSRVTTVGRGD